MEPFHFPRQPQPGDRGERRSAASAALAAQLCRLPGGPVIYGSVRSDTVFRCEGHRPVWDAFISPSLVSSSPFRHTMLKC